MPCICASYSYFLLQISENSDDLISYIREKTLQPPPFVEVINFIERIPPNMAHRIITLIVYIIF